MRIEVLETRIAPATYAPTTFTDFPVGGGVNNANGLITGGAGAGLVTLRSAIIAANHTAGSNTINLAAGTYTLSQGTYDDEFNFGGDQEATGDLDIFNNNLTIHGAGMLSTIVQAGTVKSTNGTDGNGIDRVFEINDFIRPQIQLDVTFSDFTIRNGKAPLTPAPDNYQTPGGGIKFDGFGTTTPSTRGTLTLTNMEVTDNHSAGQGAGVLATDGSLHMTGSDVSNNIAGFQAGGGVDINGGNAGIGNLQISNTTITGNKTLSASFGTGGGLLIAGVSSGTIFNTSITNNTASGTGATNGGGGIAIINGSGIALTNVTITGNHANSQGGGLYANPRVITTNAAGTMTIDGGSISNNAADFDASGAGDGGALYVLFGTVSIGSTTGVTMNGNSAVNGGAIATSWNGNTIDASPSVTVSNSAISEPLRASQPVLIPPSRPTTDRLTTPSAKPPPPTAFARTGCAALRGR